MHLNIEIKKFTKTKAIITDYFQDILKERISKNVNQRTYLTKECIGSIIGI